MNVEGGDKTAVVNLQLLESMLGKVMEEFERRIASQNELVHSIPVFS